MTSSFVQELVAISAKAAMRSHQQHEEDTFIQPLRQILSAIKFQAQLTEEGLKSLMRDTAEVGGIFSVIAKVPIDQRLGYLVSRKTHKEKAQMIRDAAFGVSSLAPLYEFADRFGVFVLLEGRREYNSEDFRSTLHWDLVLSSRSPSRLDDVMWNIH